LPAPRSLSANEAVLPPLQFRAGARKLVAQQKCKLLIVDYLQLMEATNLRDSRERQVAECSRTIKTTAVELGVPIIVLCQLNEDNRARESRAIEQDSNIFAIIEPAQNGNGPGLRPAPQIPAPARLRASR
jgi:replicative DNA helicase